MCLARIIGSRSSYELFPTSPTQWSSDGALLLKRTRAHSMISCDGFGATSARFLRYNRRLGFLRLLVGPRLFVECLRDRPSFCSEAVALLDKNHIQNEYSLQAILYT